MTNVIAADTAVIKKNTANIVEQLARQDKILEQIAWDRAVLSRRSETTQGKFMMMDKYFESLTEYAGSVCGDSVSEDVAEEMSVHTAADSEPSPIVPEETSDLMTLVIGNTHRLVIPEGGSSNKHLWTFYLITSQPELIEEVRVHLVSSFSTNPSQIIEADKTRLPASEFQATLSYT